MYELGPLGLVVLQVNSLCNLNCSYCYIPEEVRKQNKLMPAEYIEPIFRKILSSPFLSHSLTILWHAAEPLTVPIAYYETMVQTITQLKEELCPPDFEIEFGLQTNGTLINQAWCDFFKAYDIRVGVSCDGPQWMHDIYRKDWRGQGSFPKTLRGMEILKENGFDVKVLATVVPEMVEYPKEFLQFFADLGVTKVGFNPMGNKGGNSANANEDWYNQNKVYEEQYKRFLKTILQTIQDEPDKKWPTIREVETFSTDMLELGLGIKKQKAGTVHKPFGIVTIDSQGNFSTFSPELLTTKNNEYDDFIFGNLLVDTFESVTETEKFQSIYQDILAGIDACKSSCEYFSLCDGGFPCTKYGERGSFRITETIDCRLRVKIPTNVLLEALESTFQENNVLPEQKILLAV